MLKSGLIKLLCPLTTCPSAQLHFSAPNNKNAATRGHFYEGRHKKGGRFPKEHVGRYAKKRNVINGVRRQRKDHGRPELRYSYQGAHKYEWDRTEPEVRSWDLPELQKPHHGQYRRSEGEVFEWTPDMGYQVVVEDGTSVKRDDRATLLAFEAEFGRTTDMHPIRRHNPYPSSLLSLMTWRFIERLKLCRHTGLDRAIDIMAQAFQLMKLSQMQHAKENPDAKVELDCRRILDIAVQNVSPAVQIEFIQVIKNKNDGYKPCPIPLTQDQSTSLAIRRFKIASKEAKLKAPVCPKRLANLILDAYYKRGALITALEEDVQIALKNKEIYTKFGKTGVNIVKKKTKYNEQNHLKQILGVTLPLPNEEYGKLPGQPEYNDLDLLDREDRDENTIYKAPDHI